ncbi:MAG: methyltransferase domain-containing protein [candidate division FCPU426 bacterium]
MMSKPEDPFNHNDLRCPACGSRLHRLKNELLCDKKTCRLTFPIVDGIPVMIDERRSVFQQRDYLERKDTFFKNTARPTLGKKVFHLLPKLSCNISAAANYQKLAGRLLRQHPHPKVLILGGSIIGEGIKVLLRFPDLRLIETDVSFGPRTAVIVDAHQIPFPDGYFDAVIVQAVLEHVADAPACVAEIWRVLKSRALVYAETPFMQPIHGWPYDFTRYTPIGHRRLFRQFDELASGIVNGPGVALAEIIKNFLMAFFQSGIMQKIATLFVHLTAFGLKYFDYYLAGRRDSALAASGYYFMGQKRRTSVTDKEILNEYRIRQGYFLKP